LATIGDFCFEVVDAWIYACLDFVVNRDPTYDLLGADTELIHNHSYHFHVAVYDIINYNDVTSATNSCFCRDCTLYQYIHCEKKL